MPDGDAEEIEKNLPPIAGFLDAFAARGGALVAWGGGAAALRGRRGTLVPAPDAVPAALLAP